MIGPLRPRLPRVGTATEGDRLRRYVSIWARFAVVLALALAPVITPGGPVAAADGFDCKDVPRPEFPNDVFETYFDATSADRTPMPEGGGQGSTGYQSYGWAGLNWSTYDLGCGNDLVRAPDAVGDTGLGNMFMTIGKSLAAAAFWLDDQTKTGQQAAEDGVGSALENFDRILNSIVTGMSGVYGIWLGLGLTVASTIILWKAFKADAAGVTKTAGIAAAALTLGALMVGAPQKAIDIADGTFGAVITETQDEIFSVSFGDGDGAGTLAGGETDPRNVLLDKIFLEDWRKGWFGTNYDPQDVAGLGPKLRDALAFSYAEQRAVADDPNAQSELADQKAEGFREIVASLEKDHKLSYHQFQGKESGRSTTGFMAMIKLGLPSILWIGASLLKLTALLAIRLAILFAPVWVPIAIAHGGLLARAFRMLASAYLWGVAGAVIVALYLMMVVQLYVTSNGALDGSWRLWFMVLLSVVCWSAMRPFKRMTQTFTQNNASMVNRKARGAQKSMKRKLFEAGSFVAGGPASAIAEKAAERFARRGGRDLDDNDTSVTPVRPEGRGLNNRRRQELAESRAGARKNLLSQQLGRGDRLGSTRRDTEDRDARIAGIAAVASSDIAKGRNKLSDRDTDRALLAGTSAWRRLDKDEAEAQRQERRARRELATASVGQRWDGGDGSAIAPMRVYTSHRGTAASDGAAAVANSAPRQRVRSQQSHARLWDASLRNQSTSPRNTDRYN